MLRSMEIRDESPAATPPGLSLLAFADVARDVADEARRLGLSAPAFRSPPRSDGVLRSIRWEGDGSATVAVRVGGRPAGVVTIDLVEGVLEANRVCDHRRPDLRERLLARVQGACGNGVMASRSSRSWVPQRSGATLSGVALVSHVIDPAA